MRYDTGTAAVITRSSPQPVRLTGLPSHNVLKAAADWVLGWSHDHNGWVGGQDSTYYLLWTAGCKESNFWVTPGSDNLSWGFFFSTQWSEISSTDWQMMGTDDCPLKPHSTNGRPGLLTDPSSCWRKRTICWTLLCLSAGSASTTGLMSV